MHIAILMYVIMLLSIFLFKPAMMFDEKGKIKHFSYDESETNGSLMNIEIVLCTLAIICYFAMIVLELVLY
jgi:hypothetical protein